MPKRGLTPKQQAFVREYLVDLNGTQAARRAGYSAKSADPLSRQLLRIPAVAAAVNAAMGKRAARVEVHADAVLGELKHLGMSDIALAFDETGKLRALKDMPEPIRRAISGVETETRYEGKGEDAELVTVRKIRLWDKPRSLELLGKHLKLFTDVTEHRGLEGLADAITQARSRANGR